MIYFKIVTIAIAAVGLLFYVFLFDRKYFLGLLTAEIICTGFLSFYVFYYIGSYNSTDNDVQLNTNFQDAGSGRYTLSIDIEWKDKPEIFGFDGDKDQLIVRYNPQMFDVIGTNMSFKESQLGKSILDLSDDYKYSSIKKNEKEICFNIPDGENMNTKIEFKELKPDGVVKVFFLHDYKVPLGAPVYWEKDEIIDFK